MSQVAQNKLWLIWRSKNPKQRRRFRVGTLSYDEEKNIYSFEYDGDYLDAKQSGFEFYPGFNDLSTHYTSKGALFANIASRLPNKERGDYLEMLNRYSLSAESSDFEILKQTRGRLATDNFEFVPVFNRTAIIFDVAGISHVDPVAIKSLYTSGELKENSKLVLIHDSENEYDKNAVKIYLGEESEEKFIGYIPRYYNSEIAKLLDKNVPYSALVKSVDLDATIPDERVSVEVKLIISTAE